MKYIITFLTCITMGLTADGKLGGVTYFDFLSADDSTAFNFQRQYFSYAVDMSDDIRFKVIFDVGRSWKQDNRFNTFLKKAQVDYKTSFGKVSMGLIGMNTYSIQENTWGYRFVEKSAIDKNEFSSTTDIGIEFSRSLIKNLNISLQVVNGEGYKQPQKDKYHKISFNAIYGEPKLNKNDGYNAGVVYSTEATDNDPINMISIFGGFSEKGVRIGAEYDQLGQGDAEENIISISANYAIRESLDAYIRYDLYDPDANYTYKQETYVEGDDKDKLSSNYIIAGILFNCGNGLSAAPNIRITSVENSVKDFTTEYKINFQFIF